ncbi:hypothetical protein J4221_02825, partial [Candidatus Pacearchaeota archaeon]|nr:hypothetical protein [Candidatus Pacearchaeota archaeon]
ILPIALVLLVGFSILVSAYMIPNTWPTRPDIVGYEVTMPVQEGWNLLPPIFYMDEAILPDSEIQKQDISYMWYYSTNQNKYFQIYPDMDVQSAEETDGPIVETDYDNYVMTSGAWVYSKKAGTLKYNLFVSNYDYMNKRKLLGGYNFIVLTPEMMGKSLWENKGTCNIVKAYGWENEGDRQRWDDVGLYDRINSQEAAGIAIIIKVSDKCILGSSDSSNGGTSTFPPALPGTDSNGNQDLSYKCTETDDGLDYYTAGAVYYGKYDYIDSCGQAGTVNAGTPQEYTLVEGDLLEYACYGPDDDKRCTESACRFIKYHCPNGCKDGACIK